MVTVSNLFCFPLDGLRGRKEKEKEKIGSGTDENERMNKKMFNQLSFYCSHDQPS